MVETQYDFIIAGAGCAGLSLAVEIIRSGKFTDKKILIVDGDSKIKNDRTWCFWESEAGNFESIVYKQWQNLVVADFDSEIALDLGNYKYKLVRGIDFYEYCFAQIKASQNFTFLQSNIEAVIGGENPMIICNGKEIKSKYIFNSIFKKPELAKQQFYMLQHFRGWRITTKRPIFEPNRARLMDFRTPQFDATAFFYVLPFSETEALVEYTLFSNSLLNEAQYDDALQTYISANFCSEYEISEIENGVIPMTNANFERSDGNVINIGTNGGQTKGSSGYTFQFIQKDVKEIVRNLIAERNPATTSTHSWRFRFYDSVLLNILHKNTVSGAKIFMRLFRCNKASKVFRFLDNQSSVSNEISIISKLPFVPFLKAAISQILS